MRYLDPKADLTFKKVFGQHPDLVKSLLNALLPFEKPEDYIEDLEYMPAELMPVTPFRKYSIVDVRCRDKRGRQFIVEMQMMWTKVFVQRVVFNTAKAFTYQLGKGEDYSDTEEVYSLNLINDVFEPGLEDYYHYYRLQNVKYSDHYFKGLNIVFVELPKFKPSTFSERKMQVLWLRFLTEIGNNKGDVPEEMLDNPEINKALCEVEESAFNEAQLLGYDRFWDSVSTERSFYSDAERTGMEKGMEKGLEQGMKQGIKKGIAEGLAQGEAKGRAEEKVEIARNLKSLGVQVEAIIKATGLSASEIESL